MISMLAIFMFNFSYSGEWNLSKHGLWFGSKIAVQIYWCCGSWLGK